MDSRPSSTKLKVLVVDDEEEICALLRFEFEHAGLEVTTAGSVAEARNRLQADRFDLLLTDIGLPDGSGLEILEAARKVVPRVFLMTAQAKITLDEAIARGARKLYAKPFDFARTAREIIATT